MIAFGENVYIVLQTNCAVLARVDEFVSLCPFYGRKVEQDVV